MEIQGSIGNELYSDILQSSSVESGRESTTIGASGNLHESDSDDWCDEGSIYEDSVGKLNEASDLEREWQKRHKQFHTIGYRDGIIAGNAMACLPAGIKEKLMEMEETRKKFEHLHESVQPVSTTDALRLFYESHQKKLENQESNELSSTIIDSSLQRCVADFLENYRKELQSLLHGSPLVERSSKIN